MQANIGMQPIQPMRTLTTVYGQKGWSVKELEK